MRPSDIKYEILDWLYLQFKNNPAGVWDVSSILAENGVTNDSSMVNCVYSLKSVGLIKDFSGVTENAFNAAISIKGIDFISEDIKKEIHQLLDDIKDDSKHFYPLVGHLKFLPKLFSVASDLGVYMLALGLVDCRIEETDVFIRITSYGIKTIAPDLQSPSEKTISA